MAPRDGYLLIDGDADFSREVRFLQQAMTVDDKKQASKERFYSLVEQVYMLKL